jgi:hypothetical protein
MADWSTIASIGTAGGTLVLAIATFVSVRSSRRSALASERALLASIRPVLVSSRLEDPGEKVGFIDQRWFKVDGGRAVIEVADEAIYMVIALRNVGSGLAVLDRWNVYADLYRTDDAPTMEFRRLTRDIYIAAGDHGFWQGALRDTSEPIFTEVRDAVAQDRPITVDLQYGDQEGGQRIITRFALLPVPDAQHIASVSRHWHLDRSAPR